MAFVNTLRLGTARLSGRRSAFAPLLSNARSFSSVLQYSCLNHNVQARNSAFRLLVTSRGFTSSRAVKVESVSTSAQVVEDTKAVDVAAVTSPTVPAESLPIESTLADTVSEFGTNTINNIYPALQYGDLASLGLVGFTPAGLIRWSLELIQVTTQLPWFWTIIAGSLFWKLATLYVNIVGLQNSARMLPIQGKVNAINERMMAAKNAGDMLLMQKEVARMQKLHKDAGVSVGKTMLVPLVQLPITLGMFFGVKRMCELPVAQLKDSGSSWLPDLTVPDPTYILPAAFFAAVNLQIHVGKGELNVEDRPAMGHVMNILQAVTILGAYIATGWPAGLVLSLTSTTAFTTIQSLLLQNATIRKKLEIPPLLPPEKRAKFPSMLESVRWSLDYMQNSWEDMKKQQTRR